MTNEHCMLISRELDISLSQIQAVEKLLAEGGTVPFIARYRKERTGSLDEVQIMTIRDRLAQLAELDKRREAILKSLEERKLLTDELCQAVESAGISKAIRIAGSATRNIVRFMTERRKGATSPTSRDLL